MPAYVCDWEQEPAPKTLRWSASVCNSGDCRTAYVATTDLASGYAVQNRTADFGFDDVQILSPCEGLPTKGRWLIIMADELLLDPQQRRKYIAWLKRQPLPIPMVIVSSEFLLDLLTVERPNLLLAGKLEDAVFRALRDGHIDLPPDDDMRKAA